MAKLKNKKKLPIILIIFVLILIMIGGYFGYRYFTGKPIELPKIEEKPKVKIIDEKSKERPYGFMINNIKVAREFHSGLQDVYLTYEMIVEGGITRLYALFLNKNTDRIGPIRSARPYYLDYALENDAYFIHWGFSEQAKSDITKLAINNVNGLYQSKYFWKDDSLKVSTEHTAFSSMELASKGTKDASYRTNRKNDFLLNYNVEEINFAKKENANVANKVTIPYSTVTKTSYEYDPETKVYKRFVNGVAHTDYVTKEQYTVKNIITYQVKNTTLDSSGRQALQNVGNGTGYYITNGYAMPIKWSKSSRETQTKYTYLDGTEIVMNDGNTYIQIEPSNQKLSME